MGFEKLSIKIMKRSKWVNLKAVLQQYYWNNYNNDFAKLLMEKDSIPAVRALFFE
jgi:hypothetical protein